ncbi:MAG: hypothetical protein WCE79_21190 [Xanthobacteraceae bacterium]
MIEIDPHALQRAAERGATEEEIRSAVEGGDRFPAKFGRVGFRRNFQFNGIWRGKSYVTKQIEAYAVEEAGRWIVITVVAKYF